MDELNETLYKVAEMKAHFELLKKVLFKALKKDSWDNVIMLGDSKMVIEVLRMIEPEKMAEIETELLNLGKEDEKNG